MGYDNTGKIQFWKNDYYEEGGNKPYVRGFGYAHRDIKKGEKFEASMWLRDGQNPNAPVLSGDMQDPYVKPEENQSLSKTPPAGPDEDDIPF